MLVVSFAVGLVPFDPERVIALRKMRDVVFRRPIRIGDTIHVAGRIAAKGTGTEAAGIVTIAFEVVRQDGLRACTAKLDALWSRDAAPVTEPDRPCGEMVWDLA
jgi:acyl dehydratase